MTFDINMNDILGSFHRERLARAHPRESTHPVGSGASSLKISERPGLHIGSHLWRGGTVLLEFLRGNPSALSSHSSCLNKQTRVLELGSGVGLLGLSLAATKGAKIQVTLTDRDVSLLEHNCAVNRSVVEAHGGSCVARHLDWEHPSSFPHNDLLFDLILGADILYSGSCVIPLFNTLSLLMPPTNTTTVFYLCYKPRDVEAESAFFHLLRQAVHPFESRAVYSNQDHTVYQICRAH